MKLGILISGGGRTLLNLDQKIREGTLHAEISVVISSGKACAGVARARALNLPVCICPKKDLSDEAYSQHIKCILLDHGVELVVLAGFLKMFLPGKEFANACINIHPSLIPAFCGPGFYGSRVHESVWKRGCRVSGCTVHFVNDEYDAGPIILQTPVALSQEDGPDDIARKVFEAECQALPEAINMVADAMTRQLFFIENGRVIIQTGNDNRKMTGD